MHLRLQYIASFESTPFNRLQRLPHLCTLVLLKEMPLSQAPPVYQERRAFKQTQGRRGHFDTLTAVVSDRSTDLLVGRGSFHHACTPKTSHENRAIVGFMGWDTAADLYKCVHFEQHNPKSCQLLSHLSQDRDQNNLDYM